MPKLTFKFSRSSAYGANRIDALDETGDSIGYIEFTKRTLAKRKVVQVAFVQVFPQRQGVGTALYEELARRACANDLPVVSDRSRSVAADAFWKKQESKGRAFCLKEIRRPAGRPPGYCGAYLLPCPAPASLAGAGRGRRR